MSYSSCSIELKFSVLKKIFNYISMVCTVFFCRVDKVARITNWESTYPCNVNNCICTDKKPASGDSIDGLIGTKNASKKKCRVRFAEDDKLAKVHIIAESSDEPPLLSMFAAVHLQNNGHEQRQSKSSKVSLQVNFQQPISDYLSFYKILSQTLVRLENVVVSDESPLQLVGTVRVKSDRQSTSVFLRFTFDAWNTFVDFPAKPTESAGQFRTHEFSVDVPDTVRPSTPSPVQFAICFADDSGQQYWDNNDNQNYVVDVVFTTRNNRGTTKDEKIDRTDSWSEFAAWSHADSSLPYW